MTTLLLYTTIWGKDYDRFLPPPFFLTRPFFSRSLPSEAGGERDENLKRKEKKLGPFPSLPPRAQSFLPVLTRAEKGYRKEGGREKRGGGEGHKNGRDYSAEVEEEEECQDCACEGGMISQGGRTGG